MAKPGTTHVIEIETGIGEPAFIPLTMGSELQPISVGKKGMWRIESARVLDVHAFVYFDGTSLFLQSADEAQAASVDGYRVGKAWTELHAPCMIEVGAARLRFRSLSDPAQAPAPAPVEAPAPPPRPAAGAPAPISVGGGEHTAVGPVESRSVGVVRPEAVRSVRPTGPVHSGGAPVQAIPQHQHPPGLMTNSIMSGSFSTAPQPPMSGPPNPFGPTLPPNQMMAPVNSGSFGGMTNPSDSYSMNTMGGNMGSGAYPRGAPTIQTHQPGGAGDFLAKYKELSPPKRILVVLAPFCLAASAYLLLFDDDGLPPPAPVTMKADGGPPSASVAQGGCPPPLIPYSVPVNGQTLCVPQGTPMPPGPNTNPTPLPPGPSSVAVLTKPPPLPNNAPDAGAVAANPAPPPTSPAGTKTLERQAVDAVAVNDYARAAAIYEQLLAQSNPKNPVYAEAARILRQKANAAAGQPPQ